MLTRFFTRFTAANTRRPAFFARAKDNPSSRLPRLSAALLLIVLTACRSLPPLPEANLSEPGWKTRQGQAVWRAKKDAAEIAGEILLATNTTGRAFVQFTKTPFPFVIAQTTTNSWQIEAPAQNRRFARPGAPPEGIIWFQLPRATAGQPLSPRWLWTKSGTNNWRLENRWTGEWLEGYFTE